MCKIKVDEAKKILDVTCGSRSIWFNKNHPNALYCDKRKESHVTHTRNFGDKHIEVAPDIQCDFTNLPFQDDTFKLVVFDPPHLIGKSEKAHIVKMYGCLDKNWRQMIHDGFAECMRVLKKDGVLIFKWNEDSIQANEVWNAIGRKPIFGHHSGKKSKTFWGLFMKGIE